MVVLLVSRFLIEPVCLAVEWGMHSTCAPGEVGKSHQNDDAWDLAIQPVAR